jgi:hypothetical protein
VLNCVRAWFGESLLLLMLGFVVVAVVASLSEVSDHAVVMEVWRVDALSVRSGVSYVSGDSSFFFLVIRTC